MPGTYFKCLSFAESRLKIAEAWDIPRDTALVGAADTHSHQAAVRARSGVWSPPEPGSADTMQLRSQPYAIGAWAN